MISLDLSEFRDPLSRFHHFTREDLIAAILSPPFIAKVVVHLTRVMDRAMKTGSTLQEGESATIRGALWHGWALHEVTKYGETVQEGTRWRFRKFARTREGLTRRGGGATMTRAERTAAWGSNRGGPGHVQSHGFGQDTLTRNRPFEKVWNRRASGALYSSSSKLMMDTRAMQQALINMRFQVNGKTLEIRPGAGVDYFAKQNAMRPIFIWDPPVDLPKLVQYVKMTLRDIANGRPPA